MVRKPFVGGNWKCNGSLESATVLADTLKVGSFDYGRAVETVVCPPAPHIPLAQKIFKRSPIAVSAQNVSKFAEGAYTGEISAAQLKDFGVHWTLVGHSERRTKYGEDNATVAEKVSMSLANQVSVILCIGELLEEREKGETDAVNQRMLDAVIPKVTDWKRIVIAYEPVWAIGTGKVATPEQAQEAHAAIRGVLEKGVSKDVAGSVRIIYGGSVTPDNCKELISKPDIDGFLVGGASLKPTFTNIVTACIPVKPLAKPTFIKVKSIEPEQRGVNIFGKVVSIKDGDDPEVVIGDETGRVTMRVRGERAKDCVVDGVMRVQNATVAMVNGYIRLEVDKWAALKPAEGVDVDKVSSNDISAVEYELAAS